MSILTSQDLYSVSQVVYGTATARARWRECEDYVTGQMGMAVGQKFVKQEFDETAKDNVSLFDYLGVRELLCCNSQNQHCYENWEHSFTTTNL